ncbi:MAG: uridine kinase [Phycisphaerales bacterium]
MPNFLNIEEVASRVGGLVPRAGRRAVLIGISGIDGSGKGYVSARLAADLRSTEKRVAVIGIDDWHAPAKQRRHAVPPGIAFYEAGLRLIECFFRVVRPLARDGAVRFEADAIGPDGRSWRKVHEHGPVDVVIFEGVFIFRRDLRPEFDLAAWIECSYETALARAITRNQECLAEDAIRRDYAEIYFPAQRHHASLDQPRDGADVVVANDPQIGPSPA